MAKIQFSYSYKDQELVNHLASILKEAGHSIDLEGVPSGKNLV